MRAAVDMQDFTCHERRGLKIVHRVDNFLGPTQTNDGMKFLQESVAFWFVHRGVENSRPYRIEANTRLGIFDCQASRHGVYAALGEIGAKGVHSGDRLTCKGGGNTHNVPESLMQHLLNCGLRGVEESIHVRRQDATVLFLGIFVKISGHENTCIVHEQIQAPGSLDRLVREADASLPIRNIPVDNGPCWGVVDSVTCAEPARIGDDEIAIFRERLGDRKPNAARRTRDNRRLRNFLVHVFHPPVNDRRNSCSEDCELNSSQ